MDTNPWRVESIQEFSCLKCPECDYFNKEEIYFEDHAISNHPLSSVLFDKIKSASTFEVMVKQEALDAENHISVRWFSVGICKYKPDYKSHDLL